jgi:hypothetical protein
VLKLNLLKRDSLHIKNVKEAADKENSIEQAKFDLKMTLWANIGNALGGLSALFKGTAAKKAALARNSNRFCNRF